MSLNARAAYDGRNRLAGNSDMADRFDMSLSYNGRGERVARAVNRTGMPGELDGFYYNESGQLLGRQRGDEKSGGSIINEEIVWLDQTPVARVWVEDGSIQQVHAIHSDHLNTPRALANAQAQANQASGTIVWRWKLNQQTPTGSNAFGAQAATEDPDNNGTLIKFDLRFPGQQYDAATGLHYNYFRDYEAGTGRYVESDPIGLRGGVSTYGYVKGRVMRSSDPKGLFTVDKDCIGSCGSSDEYEQYGNFYSMIEKIQKACQKYKNELVDLKARECIQKRCDDDGIVECRGYHSMFACQSPSDLGAAWSWNPLVNTTAFVCVNNIRELNNWLPQRDRVDIGEVVVHEWGHTCGWPSDHSNNPGYQDYQ